MARCQGVGNIDLARELDLNILQARGRLLRKVAVLDVVHASQGQTILCQRACLVKAHNLDLARHLEKAREKVARR